MKRSRTLYATSAWISLGMWAVVALATRQRLGGYGHVSIGGIVAGFAVAAALAATTRRLGYASTDGAWVGLALTVPFLFEFGLIGLMLPMTVVALTRGTARIGPLLRLRLSTCESAAEVRNGRQALANLGPASTLCLLAFLYPGCSTLGAAAAACLASSTADTCASEIGHLVGGPTISLVSMRPCEPGTSGGVSVWGSLAGVSGSLAIAVAWVSVQTVLAQTRPASWSLTQTGLLVAVCGVVGFLADSAIGATVEARGILDNDGTNLVSSWLAGLACLALSCFPLFRA